MSDPLSDTEKELGERIKTALLLGASDMDQAEAAARALADEHEDYNLMRALETAVVVCYARAFTMSTLHKLDPDEYTPADDRLAAWHKAFLAYRNKVYAHTDKESGRSADIAIEGPVELPGVVDFGRTEVWTPLPRSEIRVMLDLFEHQRQEFHRKASRLHLVLNEDTLRPKP